MKIDDNIISYEMTGNMRSLSLRDAKRLEGEKAAAGEKALEQERPQGDAIVHLSEASKEAQRIKEAVISQPEVRQDTVASIREKVESGNYEVDYEAVANKLVDAFIDDLI